MEDDKFAVVWSPGKVAIEHVEEVVHGKEDFKIHENKMRIELSLPFVEGIDVMEEVKQILAEQVDGELNADDVCTAKLRYKANTSVKRFLCNTKQWCKKVSGEDCAFNCMF